MPPLTSFVTLASKYFVFITPPFLFFHRIFSPDGQGRIKKRPPNPVWGQVAVALPIGVAVAV